MSTGEQLIADLLQAIFHSNFGDKKLGELIKEKITALANYILELEKESEKE